MSWSEQTHRIFETNPGAFAPTHARFLELVHPDDRAAVDAAFQQSLLTCGAHALEHRLQLPDGRIKFVEERWQVICDVAGQPVRATGTCQEITERKLADLALRESNEKFHQLTDNISDAFWIRSADMSRVEYLSPAFEKIWGRSRATLLAEPAQWVEFILPEDRARVQAAFAGLMQATPSVHLEYRIVWPGGEVRWVRLRGFQVRDQAGRLIRLTGTASDITERKQAEAQLRLLETSVAHLNDIIVITEVEPLDEPGPRIVYVNEAFVRLTGYTREEVIGRSPRFLQGPKTSPEARARIREALRQRRPIREELINYSKTGQEYWLQLEIVPVTETGGRVTHAIAIERDITERKLADEALRNNEALLRMASEVSRLGAWRVKLPELQMIWSDEVGAIHETPRGFTPKPDEGIAFYAPEYQARIRQVFEDCVQTGKPFDEEMQIITARGTRRWVRVVGEAARDEMGRIKQVQGTIQDIGERKQAEEEQLRLARRLTTTLESITDAFFTLDHQWRFTYLNSEAERLLLRPAQDLLGRHIWEEFPDAVGSLFQREYERAVRERVTVGFEAYYPQPLDRWFGVRAYPSEEGLGVYFQDITATRRVREDLRVSEERFREMAENIGDVFYSFDPLNNRLLYVSPAYEKVWGRPRAEIYANPMGYLEYIDPADRSVAATASERQSKGEETTADFRVIRPDGSFRWVREHAVPVFNREGQVERVVGTIRDVTESRQASEELRKSEERYRLLFTNNPHPMWVFDLETLRILAVNTAAVEHYGYSETEFLAMRVIDLRAPEDAITPADATAWLPPVGKATALRRHRRRDGSIIEVESTSDSLLLAGRPARLVLADDVTERRRAEEKLREQAA
ncbi:MAG TPA: PAS domain S-box protein, partial [Lacunisphaera sp.]